MAEHTDFQAAAEGLGFLTPDSEDAPRATQAATGLAHRNRSITTNKQASNSSVLDRGQGKLSLIYTEHFCDLSNK